MNIKNCYFPLFVSPAVLQKEKDHIEGFAPEVRFSMLLMLDFFKHYIIHMLGMYVKNLNITDLVSNSFFF